MGLFSRKAETPEVGDTVVFNVGYTDNEGTHRIKTDQGKVKDTHLGEDQRVLVHGKYYGGTYTPEEVTIVKKAKK